MDDFDAKKLYLDVNYLWNDIPIDRPPMRDALNRVPSDFYKTEEFEELKL